MKKKLFTLAALVMLAVASLSAQTLSGKWKANGEFKKEIGLDAGQDFFLEFKESMLIISMYVEESDDDTNIKMQIVFPGTYKRSGDKVTAEFNKSKIDLEIIDIKSSDAEMNGFLNDPTMKKMLFNMIKEEVLKENDTKETIMPLGDAFSSFSIKTLTQNKLVLLVQDAKEMTFTR